MSAGQSARSHRAESWRRSSLTSSLARQQGRTGKEGSPHSGKRGGRKARTALSLHGCGKPPMLARIPDKSRDAGEAGAMRIEAFFHEPTFSVSYLLIDETAGRAALIDPVLDYD